MVSDVTINQALNQQSITANSGANLANDFSQFLQLLTVQLQNQDPLSPMDSAEFTNQLVAFSGVEQQINANQKLDDLVALSLGNAVSSAQNYIGQDISYVSSEFDYTGAPTVLRYSLTTDATVSKINIKNEQGDVVYTAEGSKNAGAHEFIWDGTTNNGQKAPPGTYEIDVGALDANETPIQVTSVVSGKVKGVETQGGQIFLLVGNRAVAISSVLNTSAPSNLSGNNESLTMALSYIGLNVSYQNNQAFYDGSTTSKIDYALDDNAAQASITIKNDVGKVVFVGSVPKAKGDNSYTWNGLLSDGTKAPAGFYEFSIKALDVSGDPITSTSVAKGKVTGIETKNGQIFINIGSKSISISKILSADVPEDTGSA